MSDFRRALTACIALMLALATVGGAVMMADSHTSTDVSPVGESEAGVVTVGIVIGAFAAGQAACDAGYTCDSPDAEDLSEADALETKKEIHQSALTQEQNNDNWRTQVSNELEDTKSIARMEGKNEYIRELNNGSAEAVARAEAREAVADYYAVRQKMMIQQWNTTVLNINSSRYTAENTSDMAGSFVTSGEPEELVLPGGDNPTGGDVYATAILDGAGDAKTVSLVNGTSHNVESIDYEPGFNENTYVGEQQATLVNGQGEITREKEGETGTAVATEVWAKPPNDNYENAYYVDMPKWADQWDIVQQYNSEVQDDIDDFVNTTYQDYQEGDITNDDLIDPYLGAREYDPENSSSWALRSATSMGIAPPSNTGDIANMTIVSDNETESGLLMTEGDYTIESGSQYNASNQTGTQYVLNPDTGDLTEVTGEYTVEEIRSPDGSTQDTAEYNEVDYQTTDTTEYQERMERLNNLTAQIEARQQRLRESGGNQQVFPGMPGSIGAQAAALGLVIALLAILGAAIAKP